MADPAQDMADSREYRAMFDESRTTCQDAVARSNRCRDYYDDKQLSPQVKQKLASRGQPETIRNRIKPAVNGWLGVLEQNKVDPRAYPRNPQQEQGADVASKVLRFVADKARFHGIKLDVADNHLVEGAGAAIVELVDGQPGVRQVRFEEFFYDPRSRMADYSDASWLGIGKWMASEDLAGLYPHFKEDISEAATNGSSAISMSPQDEDRPLNATSWVDRKLKRVFVVEMYHRKAGQWMRCVFFSGGILEEGPSPYNDDEGQPRCPIEGSSCFIDRDNRRYGVVQTMMTLQDELNARASRSLHIANASQVQVTDPATAMMVDTDVVRKEASRADGVIPMGWGKVSTQEMSVGNAQIMAETANEIDRLAPTPANLGRADANDASGRSRLVLQQAGATEQARALGRLEDWENRVYRGMWLVCKQFMDQPWWVRVAGDDKAFEFIQVNEPEYEMEPVTDPMGQPVLNPQTGEPEMQPRLAPQPVKGPDGQPIVDPQTGEPQLQPQPILKGYKHRLSEMDMDIVVETVPDTTSLRSEAAKDIISNISVLAPAYGVKAIMDVWMKLADLPEKQEIREGLDKAAAEQQQQQAAAQQAQAQQAQQDAERKNAETGASVNLKGAQAAHQGALAELATHETHGQHIDNSAMIAAHSTPKLVLDPLPAPDPNQRL